VAVVKKKKSKQNKQESAAETLNQIQSRGDDLTEWVTSNPILIFSVGALVLAIAALFGGVHAYSNSQYAEASTALAEVRLDYRSAMGAGPGSFTIPEPANPEVGQRARSEFAGKFRSLGDEYGGSVIGTLALLEAGNLEEELDNSEQAVSIWQQGLASVDSDDALRGILLDRIASVQEQAGDYESAAASHLEASEIASYPLRYASLVNAARCLLEAGDADAALAAYDRVVKESPDHLLPEHTEARLRELRAAQL
jgi:predicted negative regulator of RcsB-dependent stress response